MYEKYELERARARQAWMRKEAHKATVLLIRDLLLLVAVLCCIVLLQL